MIQKKSHWQLELAMFLLAALLLPTPSKAIADSSQDEIVSVELLTVKDPRSDAESKLRVIRLTTRAGESGYGDYLDYGLPAANAEEVLRRLVDRYAKQGYRKNIFLTDPSMRAVGGGQKVIGMTANQVLHVVKEEWFPGRAFFSRDGLGTIWQGPGKAALIIALETALRDLAGEIGTSDTRICPTLSFALEQDGRRRLRTPQEMQEAVASLRRAGFSVVRLDLARSLDEAMKSRGEIPPYRYPQEILGELNRLVAASKSAAGKEMDLVVSADTNLSSDGMTYLALHCQRNGVSLLENPMAMRHLSEQGHARKEFKQEIGFGGDYHTLEDFAQGIQVKAGTVLVPDAGRIGGVSMLSQAADLAKDARLKIAPVVRGGPLSLLAVASSLSQSEELLWVTAPYAEEWFKNDGLLKTPLRLNQGRLTSQACELDTTKFQSKQIAAINIKDEEG